MKKNRCLSTKAITLLFLLFFTTSVSADYKYVYHDHDEIVAIIQDLETQSNSKAEDIFRLEEIGLSYLGNPIYAVKFSDNPETEEDGEPDVVIDSGIHSREWLPVDSNITFIQYLFDAYYDNSHHDHGEVQDLINNFEIWIIPMINPDGRLRDDQNGGDPYRFWTDTAYHDNDNEGWRMNVQEVDCPSKPGGTNLGIDLNRSWSRRFWEFSDCAVTVYSGGDRPFVPTETRVLKQFINNHMISLVFHQHSALNILFSNSKQSGLGNYLTAELDAVYEENGLPDPLLALENELEMSEGERVKKLMKNYQISPGSENSEPACNGMFMTGQYYNWLWYEIDCPISSDHGSRRAIQGLFWEYPTNEEIYGHPDEGKIGQFEQGDSSNYFHPSSGEVNEWIIGRSIEMNKYLIRQSQFPFSPRHYSDMSPRPEAPDTDLAIVGAKISKPGDGLPGCFTYRDSDARDILESGLKRVTWNVQNNGTSPRIITTEIAICNQTDDPNCANPVTESITRQDVSSETIQTFTYDYVFKPEKDYSVTLTTGESNDYDNDLKRYVFTTIPSSGDCPAALISGYAPDKMNLLRGFRDKVLAKTSTGKEYIRLFYEHSGELTAIFADNPQIRLDAEEVLNKILPNILSSMQDATIDISRGLKKDLKKLSVSISSKASPELREAINNLTRKLQSR